MRTLHQTPRDKLSPTDPCWSSLGGRLVPRPPDRKMDPDGCLYHTGVRTPSPPQPNPVPHASPISSSFSLSSLFKPCLHLLSSPLLYISCPSISANSCWCHSDIANTSPCFVLVLYSLVYAARVTYPSYSNSTHSFN